MATKPSILIDLNIFLDVIQHREPFYLVSARLLSAAEMGQAQGYVAAHSITTLFDILQKGLSSSAARASITNLLQFIRVSPVNQEVIEQALNLDYRDFEDAVQMMAAVQGKMDCLVTHNVKDYEPALLPVMQPVDFLATL